MSPPVPKVMSKTAATSSRSRTAWALPPQGSRHVCAAKVAVLSAQEHSPNLVPVMLYGGWSGLPGADAQDNILWFREHGGIIYHHNLTFMPDLLVSCLQH